MPDRYATPAKGSSDWDQPLNNNFSDLDVDVEHRGTTDPDTAGVSPAAGAKYLDTSTGEIYTADGTSWTLQWNLGNIGSGGGSGDATAAEGIATTTDHVGPFYAGEHRALPGLGTMFWAEAGLTFESAVVDSNLAATTTNTTLITLAHYESGAANPTEVGNVTVTLSGGVERIDLSGLPAIPSSGEYVLARDSYNGETVELSRIPEANWGATAYTNETYDRIDFRKGTSIRDDGDLTATNNWYWFFDIEIGPPYDQVTSPESVDVNRIFMRPSDPRDEFSDVTARDLWINTS